MGRARWTAAVVAAGLVAGWMVTSAGASQAGETIGASGLSRFYGQELGWQSCGTDDEGAALTEAGALCADVTVPVDYKRPAGRTITVAISRIRATDPANRVGPLFFNLGGPGIPVRGVIVDAAAVMGDTGAKFDLIGMDIRFTGRSSPIDCGWPNSWIPRTTGSSRASFDRSVANARRLARNCARTNSALLKHATSANVARDMDVVRGALGDEKLSYVGYSYGTVIGATYTQLFGRNADRIVLDSGIDPNDPGTHLRSSRAGGAAKRKALNEWAALAAAHDDQLHLGGTPAEVLGLIDGIYASSARSPLKVGALTVDDTVFPALLIDSLADDNEENAHTLASFVQQLARAAAGEKVEPTEELTTAIAGIVTGARSEFHSGQSAISCGDAPVPTSVDWYWRAIQADRKAEPLFAGLNLVSPCMFLPQPGRAPRIGNDVPSLIVHADGDVDAIPALNIALHRALRTSRMVTATGVRTHGVYLFKQLSCVDGTVDSYLNTGTLPATNQTCGR